MKIELLSGISTGICPLCGWRIAFPWVSEDLPGGYIDACPEDVEKVAEDAIADFKRAKQCESDQKIGPNHPLR